MGNKYTKFKEELEFIAQCGRISYARKVYEKYKGKLRGGEYLK